MIQNALDYLSDYIGGWGTSMIATLLILAIIRIGIAFVFKLFRMNLNYRTMQDKSHDLDVKYDPRRQK